MPEKTFHPKTITLSNTKQEMLAAYNEMLKHFQERRETELKPEEHLEERTRTQVVAVADALSTDGIVQAVSTLKAEVGQLLNHLVDRLETEVTTYRQVKAAVEVQDKELHDIYEIQKAALSLAALLEAQQQKRQEFDTEMAGRKEAVEREIQSLRAAWESEQQRHEAEVQEREAVERKRREREQEEYRYTFQREQQLAKDQFHDDKVKLERDLQVKREQLDKDFAERERTLALQEEEVQHVRERVKAAPGELEAAVEQAVKEAVDRVHGEAATREELGKTEFEGERKVLMTRIASLENTVREQNEQLAKLSQQVEKAYSQVQDIAVTAIEGSSSVKTVAGLQQVVAEQVRKQTQEK